jgi:hypothetical protein
MSSLVVLANGEREFIKILLIANCEAGMNLKDIPQILVNNGCNNRFNLRPRYGKISNSQID